MGFTLTRPLRRMTLSLSLVTVAAVVPIALTAPTAAAVTFSCNHFTSGGVTFQVCIGRVTSGNAEAEITGISGTHVSGHLVMNKNGSQVASGCSGQFGAGAHCGFTHSAGTGRYEAVWESTGSGNFASPTINV